SRRAVLGLRHAATVTRNFPNLRGSPGVKSTKLELRMRPLLVCQWVIRAASWVVPARTRSEWRARWHSTLGNGWILLERGELPRKGNEWLAACARAACKDAVNTRISSDEFHQLVRSPRFLLASLASLLVLLGVFSHGFRSTRA